MPLATNAVGGIFVGQVVKYAGGVRKSFSVIAGIVITGVAEWLWLAYPAIHCRTPAMIFLGFLINIVVFMEQIGVSFLVNRCNSY